MRAGSDDNLRFSLAGVAFFLQGFAIRMLSGTYNGQVLRLRAALLASYS